MDVQSVHPGRYRDRAQVRPAALVALTAAIASGGGLWLNLVHDAAGGTGFGAPSGLVGWLLESALLLPFVLAGVWLALQLGRRLVRPLEADGHRVLAVVALAALVAGATSIAVAASGPLHAILFGTPFDHHGVAIPMAAYMVRDGLTALAANFALAGLVLLLLRGETWGAASRSLPLRLRLAGSTSLRRAFALASSSVLVASSGLLLPVSTAAVAAAAPAVGPCPAGATTKTFDVSAIDVKMYLNRFGDHDPQGQMYVLDSMIPPSARRRRRSRVSIGLRDDPIQPLVIRANVGDCVEISFTNQDATAPRTSPYGIHIDGLAFDAASSGDAVGNNAQSRPSPEGRHAPLPLLRPQGPRPSKARTTSIPARATARSSRTVCSACSMVEPEGSIYLNPTPGAADLRLGGDIVPGTGKAFRESQPPPRDRQRDEKRSRRPGRRRPADRSTRTPPRTGPAPAPSTTAASRSCTGSSYADARSRVVYSSYTFGDPTNISRAATWATRRRSGSSTPAASSSTSTTSTAAATAGASTRMADPTYDYADTGLNKNPVEVQSESQRLDSQSIGPGESYNLEIEGGAGGVQQGAGDFLFHCHIAEHYVSGMWSVWRVYDTLQPDLAPLPDRPRRPQAVDSTGLIGQTITDRPSPPATSTRGSARSCPRRA